MIINSYIIKPLMTRLRVIGAVNTSRNRRPTVESEPVQAAGSTNDSNWFDCRVDRRTAASVYIILQ